MIVVRHCYFGFAFALSALLLSACDKQDTQSAKDTGEMTVSEASTNASTNYAENTPEAAVQAWFDAMDDGDVDAARAFLSKDIDESISDAIPRGIQSLAGMGGIDKLEIVSSKLSDSKKRAVITVKTHTMDGTKGDSAIYHLRIEDGQWKVYGYQ